MKQTIERIDSKIDFGYTLNAACGCELTVKSIEGGAVDFVAFKPCWATDSPDDKSGWFTVGNFSDDYIERRFLANIC